MLVGYLSGLLVRYWSALMLIGRLRRRRLRRCPGWSRSMSSKPWACQLWWRCPSPRRWRCPRESEWWRLNSVRTYLNFRFMIYRSISWTIGLFCLLYILLPFFSSSTLTISAKLTSWLDLTMMLLSARKSMLTNLFFEFAAIAKRLCLTTTPQLPWVRPSFLRRWLLSATLSWNLWRRMTTLPSKNPGEGCWAGWLGRKFELHENTPETSRKRLMWENSRDC